MRRYGWGWAAACLMMLAASMAPAQTKLATVQLGPYGAMTQDELNVNHPLASKPGYITTGPDDGIAWRGVGAVAADGLGHVYVALPIWASGYAPKNPTRGQGDKLRLLVVDADAKGTVEHTWDFPTRSLDRLDLRTAADGVPVVFANDKLLRVGADGKPTAELDVPNEQKEYEVWDIRGSTSGRTLMMKLNNKHLMLVDSTTLAVLKQCQGPDELQDEGTLTDDLELATRSEGKFPNNKNWLERMTFCGKWEPLSAFGVIPFIPSVLDDERFLAIQTEGIALRKLSGETVWTSKAPAGLILNHWEADDRISRDGSRIAVRLMKEIQYHHPDSMNPEDIRNGTWDKTTTEKIEAGIGVWDVASGRLIGQVSLTGSIYAPDAQFALSPDGKILAVVQDQVLTVWRFD